MPRQEPLEFFFFAESHICAGALADSLESLGYEVGPLSSPPGGDGRLCISGWTTPIRDSLATFEAWNEQMRELAREHGCEFDGYGRPWLDDEDDKDEEEWLEQLEQEARLETLRRWSERMQRIPPGETEEEALERLALEAAERDYVKRMRDYDR